MIGLFYTEKENKITFNITGFNTIDLLNILPQDTNIEIDDDFYAYISSNGNQTLQFNIDDVKRYKKIMDLKRFIEFNKNLFVDTITIKIENIGYVSLSDDYSLSAKLIHSTKVEDLIKRILRYKNLNTNLYEKIKENLDSYIIIDNNSIIIRTFNNIHDYMKYCKQYHI